MSTGQGNSEPLFAAFTTGADALAYRQRTGQGGWVFVSDDGNAVWFSLAFTPSEVMTHQSVRGQNGVLR
jgi:hypothetical protein